MNLMTVEYEKRGHIAYVTLNRPEKLNSFTQVMFDEWREVLAGVAFSDDVRDIFECFDFHTQVERLANANLLYLVTEKFASIDLHPETVSNAEMGLVFEELIRKFAELSNETAGEHFTPREVIRLMVNLLFIEDDDALTRPGIVRSLYDLSLIHI